MSFFSSKHGKGKPHSEHLCGGTTDNSDRSAPKVITSKQLCYLRTNFYLSTRETENGGHNFDFEVRQDESGAVTAAEKHHSVSSTAEPSLLERLQAVIDKYRLAYNNGEDRITAGLPPEYQPCTFKALYASGEKIYFRCNNEPYSQWAEEIYTIITDHFALSGERSLLRKKEDSQMIRFMLRMRKNAIFTRYSDVNVPQEDAINGETLLLGRDVYNAREKKSICDDLIPFPPDYFAHLMHIIDKYDVVDKYRNSVYDHKAHNLGNHSRGYFGFGIKPEGDDPDLENESVTLHIKYESGTILNISTSKRGEIDGMQPLVTELLQYLDSLF